MHPKSDSAACNDNVTTDNVMPDVCLCFCVLQFVVVAFTGATVK